MREVITRTWCDEHLRAHDGEQVEASAVQLGSEGRWFGLDLCPQCRAENITPLLEFLADFGVKETSGVTPVAVVPQATVAPPRSPGEAQPAPQLFELEPSTGPAAFPDATPAVVLEDGEELCAIPDCGMRLLRASLPKHYNRHHGISRRPFGMYCPVCDETMSLGTRHFQTAHASSQEAVWKQVLRAPAAVGHGRAQRLLQQQQG